MLSLLGDQISCLTDEIADYATHTTTLREHRAEIEALLGLRAFGRADVRAMLASGLECTSRTGSRLKRAGIGLRTTASSLRTASSDSGALEEIALGELRAPNRTV